MKTIQLSKGEQAIVDDWNYEWLKQYNWFVAADVVHLLIAN